MSGRKKKIQIKMKMRKGKKINIGGETEAEERITLERKKENKQRS